MQATCEPKVSEVSTVNSRNFHNWNDLMRDPNTPAHIRSTMIRHKIRSVLSKLEPPRRHAAAYLLNPANLNALAKAVAATIGCTARKVREARLEIKYGIVDGHGLEIVGLSLAATQGVALDIHCEWVIGDAILCPTWYAGLLI